MVHPAVTVWAKRDHVSGMIEAAIGDPVDVVGFQVGGTFLARERCWRAAALAHPIGSA